MDVTVTREAGEPARWSLVDLLGRSMGTIVETAPGKFNVNPAGFAVQTMAGIRSGPFVSLDAALAEIERHTRGVCRRNAGEDGAGRVEG